VCARADMCVGWHDTTSRLRIKRTGLHRHLPGHGRGQAGREAAGEKAKSYNNIPPLACLFPQLDQKRPWHDGTAHLFREVDPHMVKAVS
jgi:hypothetical protein